MNSPIDAPLNLKERREVYIQLLEKYPHNPLLLAGLDEIDKKMIEKEKVKKYPALIKTLMGNNHTYRYAITKAKFINLEEAFNIMGKSNRRTLVRLITEIPELIQEEEV